VTHDDGRQQSKLVILFENCSAFISGFCCGRIVERKMGSVRNVPTFLLLNSLLILASAILVF